MKKTLAFLVFLLCLGLVSVDADAARRFGGGGNLGRQRPAPTMREAPREAPPSAPSSSRATQPQATPAPAPGMPPPRPSFMQRWGGLLTGLGLGALLGSMFGGHGGAFGSLFMLLILALVVYAAIRMFAGARRGPPQQRPAYGGSGNLYEGNARDVTDASTPPARPAFSGIGSAIPRDAAANEPAVNGLPAGPEPTVLQPTEVEPFLRVAKTSFIRLQAANDAGDLDDIRDYTTPEMYAEIAMQLRDRKASQKTEVVNLDAELVGTGVDDPYAYASVRFKGALRETPTGETETFDEIWNVRRKLSDPRSPWLIAGIQQAA